MAPFFPTLREPGPGEIVKTYPWVPVLYQEGFAAQLARIQLRLAGRPAPGRLFLNDLQAGPSACGCGNLLCRWTTDYGPKRTATQLGDNAPARFVRQVRELVPSAQVVPVWTTECEDHDRAKRGACAGVGCFTGDCWRVYTKQLMPVAQEADILGVLATYKSLQRDLPIYPSPAEWVRVALASFVLLPPKRGGASIPPSRLIAVLQGWDVTPAELQSQIRHAQQAGVAGYLIAQTPIVQTWEPRIVPLMPRRQADKPRVGL